MMYGYWTFTDALFDANVIQRDGWKIILALPKCDGLKAVMPDYSLMAPCPEERKSREIPAGSGLRVALHLTWDATRGFELAASEQEARIRELRAALHQVHIVRSEPYVVRVRVIEKMTGALGVRIVSAPYQGLTGVIHRANLPGRVPTEQHAFAERTAIGDELWAKVEDVKAEYMAHWQTILSLRNVAQVEHLPAVTAPPAATPAMFGRGSWRPIGDASVEAVVAERQGAIVRLIFKPKPHTQMVVNLYWEGLAGVSVAERKERFAALAVGDRLTVTPELFQPLNGALELRALERPAQVAGLVAGCSPPGEHVILSTRVTRLYKRKAQVKVESACSRGLVGWVDLHDGPVPGVGDVISARFLGVQCSAGGRTSAKLSSRVVPVAEAGSEGKSWRLVAA